MRPLLLGHDAVAGNASPVYVKVPPDLGTPTWSDSVPKLTIHKKYGRIGSVSAVSSQQQSRRTSAHARGDPGSESFPNLCGTCEMLLPLVQIPIDTYIHTYNTIQYNTIQYNTIHYRPPRSPSRGGGGGVPLSLCSQSKILLGGRRGPWKWVGRRRRGLSASQEFLEKEVRASGEVLFTNR